MHTSSYHGSAPNVLDRLRPASAIVVALMLYLSTHGHIPFLMSVDKTTNDVEGTIGLTAQAVFLLILCLLCVPYPKRLMRAARLAGPVLAISMLAMLSSLWSQDPSITLRRSVMLLGPTLFALLLHAAYGYREQLELLLIAGLAAAVLSIVLALRFPAVGLDPTMTDGSWQGIFPQKNVCARACVFFMLPALTLLGRYSGSTLLALAALPLLAGVVFMSNSTTGLILAGIVVAATLCMRLLRKLPSNESMVVGIAIAGAAVAALFFLQSWVAELLPLLGKDSTLNGRTEIWDGAIEAITKHPLLGYGFAAFWLGLKGESANVILAARWLVPTAHDGFLDVWLQLGGVGLALFLYSLYKACRAAVWCLRHIGWEAAEWCAGIVLLTLLYNLDETSLMIPRELLWTLYCLAFVNLRAMMLQEKTLNEKTLDEQSRLRNADSVAAVCVSSEIGLPEIEPPEIELPQLEPALTR
jgi:O-antigen ligase